MTQTRPDFWYRQSAALPYRVGNAGLEVLLITSVKRKRWIIPKGIVEPDLGPVESARMEARQEAGVEGVVSAESLGSYQHQKWGGVCTIEVFPLRVSGLTEVWPEGNVRERKWLPPAEAVELVDNDGLRRIIAGLAETLGEER